MTFEDARAMATALPGVVEEPSYGTPGFKVRKALLARLKEHDVLVVRVGLDEKEFLMQADPETFFETDHYKGWPAVLVRLSRVDPETLRRLLIQHWRSVAPKTLVNNLTPPVADAADIQVDARGHRCPTPTLRLRRALEAAQTGQVILLLADDPLAKIDVPHFVAANGHAVLDLRVEGGILRARIRKGD